MLHRITSTLLTVEIMEADRETLTFQIVLGPEALVASVLTERYVDFGRTLKQAFTELQGVAQICSEDRTFIWRFEVFADGKLYERVFWREDWHERETDQSYLPYILEKIGLYE